MKKRIVSLLMCLAVMSSALPVTALAAGPVVMAAPTGAADFGVSTPSASIASIVAFGGTEWYVVGYDGVGVASEPGTLTLLAKNEDFGTAQFNTSVYDGSSYVPSTLCYSGGPLHAAMTTAYNDISYTKEKALVQARTIEAKDSETSTESLPNQYFWPLSLTEATAIDQVIRRTFTNSWWLRSPIIFAAGITYAAEVSGITGYIAPEGLDLPFVLGVRPAFHLNLTSVLLISAVTGGKSALNPGDGMANVNPPQPVDPVKLTVKDTSLSLDSVSNVVRIINGGDVEITFNYDGATPGTTLSAALLDQYGALRYYGKLAGNISAGGSAKVVLPITPATGLNPTDKLLIFVEELSESSLYSADTDFCSEPQEISPWPSFNATLGDGFTISGYPVYDAVVSSAQINITADDPLKGVKSFSLKDAAGGDIAFNAYMDPKFM